jgi:hypothetical protein
VVRFYNNIQDRGDCQTPLKAVALVFWIFIVEKHRLSVEKDYSLDYYAEKR